MAAAEAVMNDEAGLMIADPGAFPAFYERTLPRVFGYFLRRCGGVAATAEDLTQDTYLAAVREVGRRGAVDAPTPWLFGIARHKLLDHYRREATTRGRPVPWHDGLAEDVPLPPLDPTAAGVDDRLAVALARLPDGQRAAIVLRYLDDLPVPATAAILGKSVHAVESLLARGRLNLKRLLAEPETSHGRP